MNILPFVISLLLIIAITSNTLLKKKVSEDIVSHSISGYMKASRKAMNYSQEIAFDAIPEKQVDKKPQEKHEKSNKKEVTNLRYINIENAKVNIYPLVVNNKDTQIELYNLAAALIHTLYADQSFYTKHFEKTLINNILSSFETQLKKDKDIQISNLVLQDPLLQKNYYKILKGTKFFDHDKKIGTPSLLDYIKYENINSKIPIKDASYELLTTVFNEKIAKEIFILQTQEFSKNLTLDNIKNICQKHNFKINESFLNFFDFFSSSTKDSVLIGFDKATNIKVKRKADIQ